MRVQFFAFAILWVGGWAVLFFYHPATACRIFRRKQTSTTIRRIQILGAVELAIVVVSLLGVAIFGLNSK
jgi:hypothetical protein